MRHDNWIHFENHAKDVIVNDLYDIAGLAIQERDQRTHIDRIVKKSLTFKIESICQFEIFNFSDSNDPLQEEYAFLKKKFSRMQELIELKKQKKVLHALKLEILALADDLEFKIIESTEEESKVIEAVEKALKQLKDEYMEVDVKDNKLEISKQSLKSQELTEKLQKLQKLHKEEVDRKKSDQLADQSVSEKPSKESEKDKKGKKSENSRENSSKKSKKDSKSKKKSKEISDIKNEKQKKKERHSQFPLWINKVKIFWSISMYWRKSHVKNL